MSQQENHPIQLLKAVAFVLLLAIPLTVILGFRLLPNYYQVREGDVSSQTIKSPSRLTFVSQVKTKEEQDRAAAAVTDVLRYNPEVSRDLLKKGLEATQAISAARDSTQFSPDDKTFALSQINSLRLSPEAIRLALAFTRVQWTDVESESLSLLNKTLDNRIFPDQVDTAKQRLETLINANLSTDQRKVALEIAGNFIEPNVLVDQVETGKARQVARDKVAPVTITLEKGETIVRDGELIKPFTMEELQAAELLSPKISWSQMGGIAILMLVMGLVLALYLYIFDRRLLVNERRLLLVALLVIGATLLAKLIIPGRDLYAYLFPLAAAPMLIATLLEVPLAVLTAAVLSITVGYIGGGSLELVAVYFVGSVVGLVGVWRAERLNRFFIAGASVAVVSFVTILAFQLMEPSQDLSRLGLLAAVSVGNGVLSAALTIGSFVLLGLIFGITTSIQLLELVQPNQPLLRRLLLEAPGSYHHSMIVANLAERAAEMIGADALLVRVGSYYHDIGKCQRPGYFVENQAGGENIHDRLEPQISAARVISHVNDGLELVKKYRLPNKVCDFISEHHGTRLATYFYHRAVQMYGDADPAPYRYTGPRPQSKETAIVMLADSVEAIVRSNQDHSGENIDRIVDSLVAEYLSDGQLDECDATLRDLEKVRDAFKGILKGVYHPRIEYPAIRDLGKGHSLTKRWAKQRPADVNLPAIEGPNTTSKKGTR